MGEKTWISLWLFVEHKPWNCKVCLYYYNNIPAWLANPFVEGWVEDFKTDFCCTIPGNGDLIWSIEAPFKFWAVIDFFTGSNVDWSPIKIDSWIMNNNKK